MGDASGDSLTAGGMYIHFFYCMSLLKHCRPLQVQSMFGDLASVTELEQRRREALGPSSTDDMNVLVLKHRYVKFGVLCPSTISGDAWLALELDAGYTLSLRG